MLGAPSVKIRSAPPCPPGDEATVAAAGDVLAGRARRRGLTRLLPFLGPAFIASVAYIDPGNFATNIQAGSKFGFLLVRVILASNLMAVLVQALSAMLGIATGQNLAELCRQEFPRPLVWIMWGLMEVVAMATDLAEFVGAAVGFNLPWCWRASSGRASPVPRACSWQRASSAPPRCRTSSSCTPPSPSTAS
jgi:manganese transport protein